MWTKTRGEIALTLTIISTILLLSGVVAGSFALRNSQILQTQADSTCLISTSASHLTLPEANKTYKLCLGNDYSGGIDINVSNITLTADTGITIDGGNSTDKSGIKITAANVNVKDISVKGFRYGLEAQSVTGIKIENSDFSNNSKGGNNPPQLGSVMENKDTGGGILFDDVTNSQIINSNASGNVSGISLFQSSNIEVSDGSYSGNSGWGIRLIKTTNSYIHDTNSSDNNRKNTDCPQGGCESAGILLMRGSNENRIENNNLNNSGNGFYINGNTAPPGNQSNNNKILNNVVNADSSNAVGNGFEATFSEGNIFQGNITSGKNYGFWLGFSKNSVINGNSAAANGVSIAIPASKCNAVLNNNTQNGDTSENNGLFPNPDDLNGQSKDCSDNYLAGNNPAIHVDSGCSNTSSTPITSCGLAVTPAPTTSVLTPPPNPTQPGAGTNPTPPPGGTTAGNGTLVIKVYKNSVSDQNLWTNASGAQVYIRGPVAPGQGFSVVMDVPTTSGTCQTDPAFESAGNSIPFECSPGVITWKGSPNQDGSYPGTSAGSYSVQISKLPSCTEPNCLVPTPYPNPAVTVESGETATASLVVISSDTPFNPPQPNNNPTPTLSSRGYTNKDYDNVINKYTTGDLSPLAVSTWLTQATRVPGLQKGICYPPYCKL